MTMQFLRISRNLKIIAKYRYCVGWVRNNSNLKGKIFIITGGNSGLGYQTAKALAKRGATVIIACRDLLKANEAIKNIKLETNESASLVALELDLESFESIRAFCQVIKNEYPQFDCLINNAGLGMRDTKLSKEGFEIHLATNHLGHFLLTNLLLEQIKKNNARVVVVSSKLHEKGEIKFENLRKIDNIPKQKKRNQLYANSKLMNFYFAKELYKKGVDTHVCCPGLCHTDFFRHFNLRFYHYILFSPIVLLYLRTAEQGAQNIIYCATDNENTAEKNPRNSYLIINLQQKKSKVDLSDKISEKLWIESSKLCELD